MSYNSRTFGNLKSGVGLVIDLGAYRPTIDKVAVTSPTTGWSMSAYVADGDPTQLSGWGAPVASAGDIRGATTTLDLDGAGGSSILLWITDLGDGPQFRVEITDVLVSS